MISVAEIYTRVFDYILEPNGPTTGVLTEQQVLDYLTEVVIDFLGAGALVSKPFVQLLQFGTGQYMYSDQLLSVLMAFVNERIISPETADELDSLLRSWRKAQPAMPRYWHEDRLPPKNVEIVPSPNFEGQYFATTGGAPFYGTLSAATTFTGYSGFYGTFSGFTGPVWLGSPMPFYGTISSVYPSSGNLMVIGPTKILSLALSITGYIPLVPPLWRDYLLYGVLAKIFRDNSETKDEARAQYCEQRWKEGLTLAGIVGEEALSLQWQADSGGNN